MRPIHHIHVHGGELSAAMDIWFISGASSGPAIAAPGCCNRRHTQTVAFINMRSSYLAATNSVSVLAYVNLRINPI